ncbi:hypothetical protein FIM02_00690 [SAR202 cluster bacterium AD-802-E10_MRT_200m]|nr:hypothetical protein [SAR202 cluster bacterium AD-802-E10_MRT_200m]
MSKLQLSLALAVREQQNNLGRLVLDGTISPEGIEFVSSDVTSGELIWRQLRFQEFDVAQMSVATLLMLAAKGDSPWVALPIFPWRSFFHSFFQVREDSGINGPEDLKDGKRIGVAEYMMTTAVWTRGVLRDEFGVQPEGLVWYQERIESLGRVLGYEPPKGVEVVQIPRENSIAAMLANGELHGAASTIPNTTLLDRSSIAIATDFRGTGLANLRPLFPDPTAENTRYFKKTGILPVNHCIGVRRSLVEKHPWIALNLYHAFLEAKNKLVAETRSQLDMYVQLGILPEDARNTLGSDPYPYGIKANRLALETLARYVFEDGRTAAQGDLEQIFAKHVLDL